MRIFLFLSIFSLLSSPFARSEGHILSLKGEGDEVVIRHFVLQLEENATPTVFVVFEKDEVSPFLDVKVVPDKKGSSLTIDGRRLTGTGTVPLERLRLEFWPGEKNTRTITAVRELGIPEQSWKGRNLPGTIRLDQHGVKVWLEGRLILNQMLDDSKNCSLRVLPGKETRFEWWAARRLFGLFEPLQFAHLAGATSSSELTEKSGIPFEVWDGGKSLLSLKRAGWPEWKIDPGSFIEAQDGHEHLYLMDEGRIPFVEVPKADYLAVYVLASSAVEPGTINAFTIRVGRRNGASTRPDFQYRMYDFAGKVPYGSSLEVIRIPFDEAFAQNVEGNILDIEITKELRLARHAPDPSRFRWRPLGLPSNVRIAAITLEKSPIQMEVRPTATAALFEQPEQAAYVIKLANITDKLRGCVVALEVRGNVQEVSVEIPPGESIERTVVLNAPDVGYHQMSVTLRDKTVGTLLTYHTAFGILPLDTRKHRGEAPWGTWSFDGQHFTPKDSNEVGEVMHKLGLRYGMFQATFEDRKRHGVVKGNEFKVRMKTPSPEKAGEEYRKLRQEHPDLLPDFLLFHEDGISGAHATRIPDLFHDRTPYKLNDQEQKRFQAMWNLATAAAKSMRKEFPNVKIHLGNGGMTLREDFYRNQFPAELFDAGGNESGGFGRPPEAQPPDVAAVNASLWMDRQMLDAYGYKDKFVSQAYEAIYPGSNPGNLSLQTQADYFARHILHAMAWGVPKIRPGIISDVGNSYYQSNWGATGFLTARPERVPKPAAIALAALTRALDGATYEGFLETGSDSAYLLRFQKKEGGQVFSFWTVRGQREYILEVAGASKVALTTGDGKTTDREVKDGLIKLVATASPSYLELPPGASLQKVKLGLPVYPGSEPKGTVTALASLESLDGWKVEEKPNSLLDFYNPMTPRRKGDFSIEVVKQFEGTGPSWKVAPRPIEKGKPTMPMYAELVSEKKIELPGKPAEIGLWVNGNSGWGRIIYELEDASGQRWTSVGARSEGGSEWTADWLGKELSADYKPGEIADWNTDDVFGLSRFNFDGWRYVGFPLPGQYPGEGYHWPFNSQWRWDKEGIVHYPLTLKKLIIELPEKMLHLARYEAPQRPEIYLRNLVSVERDMDAPKTSPREYVEDVQITVN